VQSITEFHEQNIVLCTSYFAYGEDNKWFVRGQQWACMCFRLVIISHVCVYCDLMKVYFQEVDICKTVHH